MCVCRCRRACLLACGTCSRALRHALKLVDGAVVCNSVTKYECENKNIFRYVSIHMYVYTHKNMCVYRHI